MARAYGCKSHASVERKIHPDLNSLAEELSSQDHGRQSNEESIIKKPSESSRIETAGFVGLAPRSRRRNSQKEVYTNLDNNDRKAYQDSQSRRRRDEEKVYQYQKEIDVEWATNESISRPTITDASKPVEEQPSTDSPMQSAQTIRWSPFGQRTGLSSASRQSDTNLKTYNRPRSTSQSSLQSHSTPTSMPYMPSAYNQPQTPGSETRSLQTSTPQSAERSTRTSTKSTLPSPYIFGARMSSRSPGQSKPGDSYFDFKGIPPPLPPLDHPAFRESSSSVKMASVKHSFPSGPQLYSIHCETTDFSRHVTHSLPSLTHGRSSPRVRHLTDEKEYTRRRSKSNTGYAHTTQREDSAQQAIANRSLHSRNQSKSSVASSRRSSAEYSAKQVSSIGHELTSAHEGCWEVEVSKAMVSLALGAGKEVQGVGARAMTRRPIQDANTSALGKARGDNRAPGGDSRLGSPFLLQDSCADTPGNRQLPNNHTGRPSSKFTPQTSSRESGRGSYNNVMSNGDAITQPPGSSASQTTKKGTSASDNAATAYSTTGSRSRRGGRASSTPSLSETPPLSHKVTINQTLDSIHGSSSLRPPSLSVTAATPVPSPISPTRRGHHKSTPTMPTTSVLKTPSTPPVIEKSHSSGSGKRKAEEAGVGGDKTPPKESKEPRATFAPEPRTHRASGNSGTSTHAPSSFNRSKRVRLTESSETRGSVPRSGSIPTPDDSPPNAKSTGSWSSRGSHRMSVSSHRYGPPPAPSASHPSHHGSEQQNRPPSRRSLSQASIPLSALISPHAPSIAHSGTFHMRDPRKPNPIQRTPWSLSFPSRVQADESRWAARGWVERGGSPLHAWLFFIGFILFPIWWIAALFIPIPPTRRLGESEDAEKGVILDDPQVEYDAKSWRMRCRVMAGVSLLTYVPFITLVAIYA